MKSGFGYIRMQHAINYWDHFEIEHFERIIKFRQGFPIERNKPKTNWISGKITYPLLFSFLLRFNVFFK